MDQTHSATPYVDRTMDARVPFQRPMESEGRTEPRRSRGGTTMAAV